MNSDSLTIKEEKHTPQSVAFAIDLDNSAKQGADPQIKKKLESEQPSNITLE